MVLVPQEFWPLYQLVLGFGTPARRTGQMWFFEGLLAGEASGPSVRIPTGVQQRAAARGAHSR